MNLESAHSDLSIGVPLGESEPVLAPGNLFEDDESRWLSAFEFVCISLFRLVSDGWCTLLCQPSSSTRDQSV